tara:strand:- start:3563 stop:4534 length:972 start_codon:yes stop_codon:yes gene_type:complete
MRVRNINWIFALGIALDTLSASNTDLQNFINSDDFQKIDLILASEPQFDVNENDHSLVNPNQSGIIPSVHRNPLEIQIDNIKSPIFTEDHIVIPDIDNASVPSENETESTFTTDSHSDDEINIILSSEPIFNENENIPTKKDEDVPDINTETDNDNSDNSSTFDTLEYVLGVDDVISTDSEELNIVEVTNNLETNDHVIVVVDKNVELDAELKSEWEQNITDLGNSWYYVDWFGHFFSTSAPSEFGEGNWIYHIHLGWVFISSEAFTSVWIYSDNLQDWMWTSNETYPYTNVHSNSDFPKWLYFDVDRGVVYDFEASKYFDIN